MYIVADSSHVDIRAVGSDSTPVMHRPYQPYAGHALDIRAVYANNTLFARVSA